jgi:hypothetical protein
VLQRRQQFDIFLFCMFTLQFPRRLSSRCLKNHFLLAAAAGAPPAAASAAAASSAALLPYLLLFIDLRHSLRHDWCNRRVQQRKHLELCVF